MNEIMVTVPDITYESALVTYNFTTTDNCIDELEKRYKTLKVNDDANDKKEAKQICADLNKVKKALNDEAIKIEKEASSSIKEFRSEMKKRTDRLEEIRKPLWEQVKPLSKPKAEESPKAKKIIKACYLFEGDEEYIDQMIKTIEFAGVKVTEVKL